MTAPLEDKRLEAAAQIVCAGNSQQTIDKARAGVVEHTAGALAMLSTAIRETHASELAEALERCIPILENLDAIRHISPDFPALDNARAVLASYKEIANGL